MPWLYIEFKAYSGSDAIVEFIMYVGPHLFDLAVARRKIRIIERIAVVEIRPYLFADHHLELGTKIHKALETARTEVNMRQQRQFEIGKLT